MGVNFREDGVVPGPGEEGPLPQVNAVDDGRAFPFETLLAGGRLSVHGKDVHVQPELVRRHPPFDAYRPWIMDLGEEVDEVLFLAPGVVKAAVGSGTVAAVRGREALEVRARHQYVHVVVPGDESLVADRSEQGAVCDGVAQTLPPAEGVHIREDVQQPHLDFPQVGDPFHQNLSTTLKMRSRTSSIVPMPSISLYLPAFL